MAKNSYIGELCAEFLGTMILILFGTGVVAQVVTNTTGGAGNHDSIAWAWGIGVTLGVYVAARLSGAHLNPAVTIALAAFKGFAWRKVLPYSLAQTLGAFVAAIIVRFIYADLIAKIDPDHTIKSQGIFSTLPGNGLDGVSITDGVLRPDRRHRDPGPRDLRADHGRNNGPLANLGPVVVGLLVVGIGMAWGANAGYAINPARDFGPRLASLITGYSDALFDQHGTLYFWLPIVAPIIGGLIGGAIFKYMIERFLPEAEGEDITVSEPAENP